MKINCDTCAVREIACGDCFVTHLLSAPDISSTTAQAIELLSSRGIVAPLRFERRVQG